MGIKTKELPNIENSVSDETYPSIYMIVWIMCTDDRGDGIIPNPSN